MKKLFEWALRKNDEGHYFPVWGTCLGFENLAMFVGGGKDVLRKRKAYRQSAKMHFKENPLLSKMFRDLGS